jgi:hypothetical protein
MLNKRIMSLNEFARKQKNEAKREDKKIKSDYDFMEYAKEVLKDAHGDNYDERKAEETIEGILKKADGDYEKAIGMLQSGLGD